MSVVAARKYNNQIEIAADSILLSGCLKKPHGFQKLESFDNGNLIIGTSGLAAEGAAMWCYARNHKPIDATEKGIMEFLSEFRMWKHKETDDYSVNNNYIIVYLGHIFYCEGVSPMEVVEYCAIGAGEDYAYAAMYLGECPRKAVETACALSCLVCEPIKEIIIKA